MCIYGAFPLKVIKLFVVVSFVTSLLLLSKWRVVSHLRYNVNPNNLQAMCVSYSPVAYTCLNSLVFLFSSCMIKCVIPKLNTQFFFYKCCTFLWWQTGVHILLYQLYYIHIWRYIYQSFDLLITSSREWKLNKIIKLKPCVYTFYNKIIIYILWTPPQHSLLMCWFCIQLIFLLNWVHWIPWIYFVNRAFGRLILKGGNLPMRILYKIKSIF